MKRIADRNTIYALLKEMKTRKALAEEKLLKIKRRIQILDSFINESIITKCKLKQFLQQRNMDVRQYFVPIGYYLGNRSVVSNDNENQNLSYHKGMNFDRRIGYHTPIRKMVTDKDHDSVVQSLFGFNYNEETGKYFPKVSVDADIFYQADGQADVSLDIMGGLTLNNIANLENAKRSDRVFLNFVKDLYEDEYDNILDEVDVIDGATNKLSGRNRFSYAEGDVALEPTESEVPTPTPTPTSTDAPTPPPDTRKVESGKNMLCHTSCNVKHLNSRRKRRECQEKCDLKFKPASKQVARREERHTRIDTRVDFRAGKRECKERKKSGELSEAQYKECLSQEKAEKKAELKEHGGNFLLRTFRTFSKINPAKAVLRGAILVLVGENFFGFATIMAPATLEESKAKELFKAESITKSKKAWEKLKKAWLNLGGEAIPMQNAIKRGWNKRVKRTARREARKERKSKFDGVLNYEYETYSNIEPASVTIIAAVATGISGLAGLLSTILKAGADKKPYLSGKEPDGWNEDKDLVGTGVPSQDPNQFQVNPETGEWYDPTNGKIVDPTTGEYKNEIFGINKWVAIGIGVAGLFGLYFLTTSSKNT